MSTTTLLVLVCWELWDERDALDFSNTRVITTYLFGFTRVSQFFKTLTVIGILPLFPEKNS
jgi:hypothetical protein